MNLYTNGMSVFGDFSIFNMLYTDETGEMPGFFESGSLQMDEVNYLQKGEKIFSLLRKKRQNKMFAKDNILELIKSRWELTQKAVAKKIGAKLEQEIITAIESAESGDVILDACNNLCGQLSSMIEIVPEKRSRQNTVISTICSKQQKAVLNVKYNREDIVIPVGTELKKRCEGAFRLKGDWESYINVKDFKKLIAELYLRQYLLNKLRILKKESGSEEQYANHRVIGKLQVEFKKAEINSEYHYLKEHLSQPECCYGILLFYPEADEAEYASLMIDCLELQKILYALQDDYQKRRREAKMDKELSIVHAKSFQTKKNIPQKCIRAMSRSGFNNYFGYVEFDEECDLPLMEELYKEYRAFAEELELGEYPEVSLRFRKLGNHKASGLYYYILKCLCVDVRSPGSMVHEVGHMIDYHLGHISIQYSYQEIYELYEKLLRDYVTTAKDTEVAVLKGKSKYNLDYYLQPTEVFARCFEMYVIRIRGIDNSLCRPNAGFAYPENERLMELIKDFYDGIFKKEVKKEEAA